MTPGNFKYFLLFAALCIRGMAGAQSSDWIWGRAGNSNGPGGEGLSICSDRMGNTFITGYFRSDSISFGNFTLVSANSLRNDSYLVKYDSSGNVLWAQLFGGNNHDEGYSVCCDSAGNVYLTGDFSSPSISFGNITLTNSGGFDFFLAKLDPAGNVLWARSAAGNNDDVGKAVTADNSGNIYVTGYYMSTAITFGTITTGNASAQHTFITKYNSSGNAMWVRVASNTGFDWGNSISCDASGNVYLTGGFDDNPVSFGSNVLSGSGIFNVYVVKYNPAGGVLWATGIDGGNFMGANSFSISADAAGNSYVAGAYTYPTITFGSTTLTNSDNSGNFSDMFLAKYDPSGNVLWAQTAGGSGYDDQAYSTAFDSLGNIYVAGGFQSPFINLGTVTLMQPPSNCFCDPMFIALYRPDGTALCGSSLPSGGDDWCDVSVDRFDKVYITGDFYANPFIVGPDTLAFTGGENIFTARYRGCHILTGLETSFADFDTNVFPDPNNGKFQLTIGNENLLKESPVITIYNNLGQEVYRSTIEAQNSSIDISAQPAGIYFYQVRLRGEVSSGKIIIQ